MRRNNLMRSFLLDIISNSKLLSYAALSNMDKETTLKVRWLECMLNERINRYINRYVGWNVCSMNALIVSFYSNIVYSTSLCTNLVKYLAMRWMQQ